MTLPDAVSLADQFAGSAITFDPSVFTSPTTIMLTGQQLELSNTAPSTSITGPVAALTVSGGGNSRVFEVDSGVTASLSRLAITGGSANFGGGLDNLGTTTVADVAMSGNSASISGSDVDNTGTVDVANVDYLTATGSLTNAGTITGGTGSTVSIGTLNVAGGSISSSGSFAVTGTTSLATSAVFTGPSFTFGGAIEDQNQPNDLTIDGNASFRGDVGDPTGGDFALHSLTVTGTTTMGPGLSQVNTVAGQTYTGGVVLASSAVLTGSTVTVGGPIQDVNQPNDLRIDGNASFGGDVGPAGR